jgi:hypothetical protein
MSFDMLRESQSKMMEGFTQMPGSMTAMNPMNPMSGIEAMKRQQRAFLQTMVPGWKDDGTEAAQGAAASKSELSSAEREELDDIRAQLAELKDKMSKLGD